MRLPKFRVGQTVKVASSLVSLDKTEHGELIPCRVLFPRVDGTYFVEVPLTGGYAVVEEVNIHAETEEVVNGVIMASGIRVLFFGNGLFALPTLKMLVERGYNVVGVVTMDDKPSRRGGELHPSPVKDYAQQCDIPVFHPNKIDSQRFRRKLYALKADIGVIVEYKLLPHSVYSIPKWGTLNLHSSLLPMYRGASTIASAIKNGDALTGVTTFMLNNGIDTGGIINNMAVPIWEEDNAADVHCRLRTIGADMVNDAIMRVAHGATPVTQQSLISDFIEPSYAPKLYRKHCRIPWWKPTKEVYNFIRALSPLPTAWTSVRMLGKETPVNVKIYQTATTGIPRGVHAPGELLWLNRKLMVACGDELLSVEVLQMPGKGHMTALEFYNGFRGACKGFCEIGDTAELETNKE